ncbi:DUF6630 family protein [Nocardia lijiangensis]|uniref:DUF6630 family protein n=1 Tax=Nocardia lijiangensis TaxID=299618 RepID=UPI00083211EF|nr:hypothetical protein [Nocardia lijiangensis]
MDWELQRDALIAVAKAIAPDQAEIAEAVRAAADKHPGDSRHLVDARIVLLERLEDAQLVAWFDWKSDSEQVRKHLEWLCIYPGDMSWTWYESYLREVPDLDSAEIYERFLDLVGERSYEVGAALVGIDTESDSYAVTFVPVAQVPELLESARRDVFLIRLGSISGIEHDVAVL